MFIHAIKMVNLRIVDPTALLAFKYHNLGVTVGSAGLHWKGMALDQTELD